MKYPAGPMTVGDILSRGFGLLFARFGLLYSIMLVVQLPVLALELALPDLMVSGFGQLALIIPTFILQTIGTGAILRVVMQEYLDRPITFGEAFRYALSRFGELIGTSLLSGLIIFLGTLFCIIPGIYFAIVYSLAAQVVVVEDLAGMGALRRSQSLVNSGFGRVFGVLFLAGLLSACLSGGISAAAGAVLPYEEATAAGPGSLQVTNYPNYAVNTVLTTLLQILAETYTAVCVTLLYFDLRNRTEAFDLALEADRISAWTERFRPRPHEGGTDIQAPDVGIVPPGPAAPPPETGIRPAEPEPPPHP